MLTSIKFAVWEQLMINWGPLAIAKWVNTCSFI